MTRAALITLAAVGYCVLTLAAATCGQIAALGFDVWANRASSEVFALAPYCATEDSTGFCKWDSTVQGNGRGDSFIAVAGFVFLVSTN